MVGLYILYIAIFVIFALVAFAVVQIKLAGMNVKDFWSFIEANEKLDQLYAFSKFYDKMSTQQQILYLAEAEKIFDAFDKVPDILWEEDYDKYTEVLDKYKYIKMLRWSN